jgi:hypothetical protein
MRAPRVLEGQGNEVRTDRQNIDKSFGTPLGRPLSGAAASRVQAIHWGRLTTQ